MQELKNNPDPEANRRLDILKAVNPIFDGEVHFPAGFKDFRGITWPCDFRAGPYYRVDNHREWKQHFGQVSDAWLCVDTLKSLGMESIEILSPRLEQLDGEALRTSIPYFTVKWLWPESPL